MHRPTNRPRNITRPEPQSLGQALKAAFAKGTSNLRVNLTAMTRGLSRPLMPDSHLPHPPPPSNLGR